jgi:phage tail tape-measure protein
MKKTAVEWLIEIFNITNVKLSHHKLIIEQAKEMEKEQIKNAWLNSLTKGDYNSADEYYNETFNKKA